MFCPSCGARNATGVRTCWKCGKPLPWRRPGILVLNTEQAGTSFELDRAEATIGRTDDNDIILLHRSVSWKHAKLILDGGAIRILDLKSDNGVLVNGAEVEDAVLRRGDVIELGRVRLRLVGAGESVALSADEIERARLALAEAEADGRPPEQRVAGLSPGDDDAATALAHFNAKAGLEAQLFLHVGRAEQLETKYREAVQKLKQQVELNTKIDAAYKELAEKHCRALSMLKELRDGTAALELKSDRYNETVQKLKQQVDLNMKIDVAYKELAERHRELLAVVERLREEPDLVARMTEQYGEAVKKLKAQVELNKKIELAYKELAHKHREALVLLKDARDTAAPAPAPPPHQTLEGNAERIASPPRGGSPANVAAAHDSPAGATSEDEFSVFLDDVLNSAGWEMATAKSHATPAASRVGSRQRAGRDAGERTNELGASPPPDRRSSTSSKEREVKEHAGAVTVPVAESGPSAGGAFMRARQPAPRAVNVPRPMTARPAPLHGLRVFVDGANIARRAQPGKSIAAVKAVIRALTKCGAANDGLDVVFDAKFLGWLSKKSPLERPEFESGETAGLWTQAPPGKKADGVMLARLVDDSSVLIVSNDTFRDERLAAAATGRQLRHHVTKRDVLLIFPEAWNVDDVSEPI